MQFPSMNPTIGTFSMESCKYMNPPHSAIVGIPLPITSFISSHNFLFLDNSSVYSSG